MLFQRRKTPALKERMRVYVWPRRSWARSSRYVLYRLWRLRATPHAIGLGCAAGVFVSFLPFLGMHFIMAGVISWLTRASIIASALGTFIGNPVTFPFIWIGAYQLGAWMLGQQPMVETIDLSAGIFQSSLDTLWPLIKPMTIGGVPLGLLAGAVSYYLVKRAVEAYQSKRRRDRRMQAGGHTAQA